MPMKNAFGFPKKPFNERFLREQFHYLVKFWGKLVNFVAMYKV